MEEVLASPVGGMDAKSVNLAERGYVLASGSLVRLVWQQTNDQRASCSLGTERGDKGSCVDVLPRLTA